MPLDCKLFLRWLAETTAGQRFTRYMRQPTRTQAATRRRLADFRAWSSEWSVSNG